MVDAVEVDRLEGLARELCDHMDDLSRRFAALGLGLQEASSQVREVVAELRSLRDQMRRAAGDGGS